MDAEARFDTERDAGALGHATAIALIVLGLAGAFLGRDLVARLTQEACASVFVVCKPEHLQRLREAPDCGFDLEPALDLATGAPRG